MLYYVFIWFLDQENIGLDPKIMILHEVIPRYWKSQILRWPFWKMAEISSESQFFSSNIVNMIPEGPLNKMVPLTEDHGGCMGTPVT